MELGQRCVALVKEFTPMALTVLESIPPGVNKADAQRILPRFIELATRFRYSNGCAII